MEAKTKVVLFWPKVVVGPRTQQPYNHKITTFFDALMLVLMLIHINDVHPLEESILIQEMK